MGKIPILTQEQKIILDEIKNNQFLSSNFYFTGGTALSHLYLKHRYSEDLDFFSEEKLDNQIILTIVSEWAKKHQFKFQSRFVEVVYRFDLIFPKQILVKLDFGYYPYKRLRPGKILKGIMTDSIEDIAVNKLLTISQSNDVKDFVDLYFILQTQSLLDLMEGLRIKFNMIVEPLLLAADFLKVEEFDYLPKMIKPLTLKELKLFFQDLSKKISGKALS